MSWFLKNKKKTVALLVSILIFTPIWWLTFVIWLSIALYSLNKYSIIHLSSKEVLALLYGRKQITKINTIIIGDTCTSDDIEKYKLGNTIAIQFPDRNLEASYQIFMHIESLLEDKGRLIILHDNRIRTEKLSIFDTPYIHPITIKELKQENLNKKIRHPFIYEPIKSLKYLLDYKKSNYKNRPCPKESLNTFCKEREIELIYLRKE